MSTPTYKGRQDLKLPRPLIELYLEYLRVHQNSIAALCAKYPKCSEFALTNAMSNARMISENFIFTRRNYINSFAVPYPKQALWFTAAAQGFSIVELQERLNLPHSRVQRLIQGRKWISNNEAQLISQTLNFPLPSTAEIVLWNAEIHQHKAEIANNYKEGAAKRERAKLPKQVTKELITIDIKRR